MDIPVVAHVSKVNHTVGLPCYIKYNKGCHLKEQLCKNSDTHDEIKTRSQMMLITEGMVSSQVKHFLSLRSKLRKWCARLTTCIPA